MTNFEKVSAITKIFSTTSIPFRSLLLSVRQDFLTFIYNLYVFRIKFWACKREIEGGKDTQCELKKKLTDEKKHD